MAEKKSTVDNWKKKKWYDVHADPTFDEKKIGETVAIVPKNLVGRNIKKGLNELTGNIRDSSFEITFKVNKITGAKADTIISKFLLLSLLYIRGEPPCNKFSLIAPITAPIKV